MPTLPHCFRRSAEVGGTARIFLRTDFTTRRDESCGSDAPMTLDLLVSGIAMALGAFAAATPQRAAEIWDRNDCRSSLRNTGALEKSTEKDTHKDAFPPAA